VLLAKGGLYASMWNRQREADEAREKLAQIGDTDDAPNRNPPLSGQNDAEPDSPPPDTTANSSGEGPGESLIEAPIESPVAADAAE
jgi:ATP-binding cassette subfamily B protein